MKTLKLKFQIESSSRLRQFEKQKALAETVGRRQLRKQFCALNARGRFYTAWINSGQTAPSDLTGSAVFEPFVWTGRVLQAEDADLEKLVLRFYIRSMRLLNAP